MDKSLLDIKHHCNRRLFKFDLVDVGTDIVLSNMWTKDFKPTNASYDGLRALKYYARQRGKLIHVVTNQSKVFNLLYNEGFHQNLLMKGKGDISNHLGKNVLMYTWGI